MLTKYLSLFLLSIVPVMLYGQGGVVSAPVLESIETANKATLLKQLSEAIKQTGQLGETYKVLEKSVKLYYEVSATFKAINAVENVLNKQIDLVNTCSRTLKEIPKVKGASTQSIIDVKMNINKTLSAYQENLKLINQLLGGELRMDDAGRLQLVMKVDEKTDKAIADVNSYRSAFEAGAAALRALRGSY